MANTSTVEGHQSRPQVLVLGNGILRAFGGAVGSCGNLEDMIYDAANITPSSRIKGETIPFPMRIAASFAGFKDRHSELKKAIKSLVKGRIRQVSTEELFCNSAVVGVPCFNELLKSGFSDVITTNYGYEIEKVLCGKCPLTGDEDSDFLRKFSAPKNIGVTERKFKIWKHYLSLDKKTKIWHVHGEYLKPQTIIFEFSDYCSFMMKVRNYPHIDNGEKTDGDVAVEAPRPWVENFLCGDVYILGFGADFGESVFWRMMEQRNSRDPEKKGDVYFYEPAFTDVSMKQKHEDRLAMLKAFHVECLDLEVTIKNGSDFKVFYGMACDDIVKKMQARKNNG